MGPGIVNGTTVTPHPSWGFGHVAVNLSDTSKLKGLCVSLFHGIDIGPTRPGGAHRGEFLVYQLPSRSRIHHPRPANALPFLCGYSGPKERHSAGISKMGTLAEGRVRKRRKNNAQLN